MSPTCPAHFLEQEVSVNNIFIYIQKKIENMEDKENIINQLSYFNRPTHQGRAFKLQLGHNNGPFLAKDIMHSNKTSAYLIAAKQVLESHQSMSSLIELLNKEAVNQKKTVRNECKVQSWYGQCQLFEEELKCFQSDLKKLKVEQDRLKIQLKTTFLRLTNQNQQLSENFLPLFKNLLKTIRDQSLEQQNIFEEKKRDIEQLANFRNTYLDQLVSCERRIIKVQDFLGVDQKSNQDD